MIDFNFIAVIGNADDGSRCRGRGIGGKPTVLINFPDFNAFLLSLLHERQ